jgi:uncharacterized protein (TIGR03000 family)
MGAPVYAPPGGPAGVPPKEEQLKVKPKPTTQLTVPAPAIVVVQLSAEAKLLIDDFVTSSTSGTRVFTSPALQPGKDYYYTLKATITREGRPVTLSQRVLVHAGQESRVQLQFPVDNVARR